MRAASHCVTDLSSIVAFDQDERAKVDWIDAVVGGTSGTQRSVPPADAPRPASQLLCLDDLFYARASHFPASPYFVEANGTSRKYPDSPLGDVDQVGWIHIGQWLRFRSSVDSMADLMLRDLMQLPKRAPIPPFISLHLRRGDFGNRTQVEPFALAVQEIRDRLEATPAGRWRGRSHELVVVAATDEKDAAFRGEMRGHGWFVIDHEAYDTVRRHGPWYPTSASACLARS